MDITFNRSLCRYSSECSGHVDCCTHVTWTQPHATRRFSQFKMNKTCRSPHITQVNMCHPLLLCTCNRLKRQTRNRHYGLWFVARLIAVHNHLELLRCIEKLKKIRHRTSKQVARLNAVPRRSALRSVWGCQQGRCFGHSHLFSQDVARQSGRDATVRNKCQLSWCPSRTTVQQLYPPQPSFH